MKISIAKQFKGFTLSVGDESATVHLAFTSIHTYRNLGHIAQLFMGDDHKSTIHVIDQDNFWKMVGELNVPVVFVSSSAMEGTTLENAA